MWKTCFTYRNIYRVIYITSSRWVEWRFSPNETWKCRWRFFFLTFNLLNGYFSESKVANNGIELSFSDQHINRMCAPLRRHRPKNMNKNQLRNKYTRWSMVTHEPPLHFVRPIANNHNVFLWLYRLLLFLFIDNKSVLCDQWS